MVSELSPAALQERLDAGTDLAILDIRDERSFADGHIPGSENRPARQLNESILTEKWPAEVVVTCYMGKSSKRIAGLLNKNLDANVSSLRGGFDGWDGAVESGQSTVR